MTTETPIQDTIEYRAVEASYGILVLKERLRVLEDAVLWALGENGDFRVRYEGEGAYWWRKELRDRAGLNKPSAESAPS